MFTGIIEHSGTIESLDVRPDGGRVTIHAPTLALNLPSGLAVSNSIAVNGCCLTIVSVDKSGSKSVKGGKFSADLSGETLRKTSFGAASALKPGTRVNLEQPLTAGKEFGGHFVLGHVDAVGQVAHVTREGDSWLYGVHVPEEIARYIVPQGSITIDGISLTIARYHCFPRFTIEIAIIPYTYDHTNIRDRQPGDAVNLEADILGKTIALHLDRHLATRPSAGSPSKFTVSQLTDQGF